MLPADCLEVPGSGADAEFSCSKQIHEPVTDTCIQGCLIGPNAIKATNGMAIAQI